MSTAASDNNNTVAATLADPQYKAGRKLIDEGRLEEAVNFFSGLLETRVQVLSGNEMCPALAPLYYEYGNSLLYNAEESGAVFGDAITDAEEKKRAMAIVEAQINGQAAAAAAAAEGEGAGANDGGGAAAPGAAGPGAGAGGGKDGEAETGVPAPTPDQEAEEDLEIAWENLEMARRIYSELELTEEVRTAIAKVSLLFVVVRRKHKKRLASRIQKLKIEINYEVLVVQVVKFENISNCLVVMSRRRECRRCVHISLHTGRTMYEYFSYTILL